jgi:hypothetical protein
MRRDSWNAVMSLKAASMASNFLPAVAQAWRLAGFFRLFDFGEGSVRFQKPNLVVAGHAVQGEIVDGIVCGCPRGLHVFVNAEQGGGVFWLWGAAIPQSKAALVQNRVVRIGTPPRDQILL